LHSLCTACCLRMQLWTCLASTHKHWARVARYIWRRLSTRLSIDQGCAVCEGMSGAELREVYSEASGDWQWLIH
jgi:hypothetical protein